MLRRPPVLALAALVLIGAACSSSDADSTGASVPEATPVPTIGGVGVLPEPASSDREPIVMIRPPVNADGSAAELIGEVVENNRVLLIGDSILASTSRRYGNNMCTELVPLGWQVQVEAEPSQFVDFGTRVLDRVLPDDGDADPDPDADFGAAVVFLGSNYGSDRVVYEAEMREILDRLAPRPTLLLTVTEYKSNYAEVNEVLHRLADEYDNVTLVDWQSVAQTPGVLSGDRLHPSDQGRQVLAELVAASLGQVAIGEGDCLSSDFTDDSRSVSGSGAGSSVGSGSSSSGSSSGSGRGGSSGSGSSSGGSGSAGSGSGSSGSTGGSNTSTTLAPPTTSAPPTVPTLPAPTTAPPTTAAPPPVVTAAPPTTAVPPPPTTLAPDP